MAVERLAPDTNDDDLMLVSVATGVMNDGSGRPIEVLMARKGGGIMVRFDNKPENRFFVPLEDLVSFAVDLTFPVFAEGETVPEAQVATGAEPAPTGEAAPMDPRDPASDNWVPEGPQG